MVYTESTTPAIAHYQDDNGHFDNVGRYRYAEAPFDNVSPHEREVAARAIRHGQIYFGLDGVSVQFVRQTASDNYLAAFSYQVAGFCMPHMGDGTTYALIGQSDSELTHSVLHEIGHVASPDASESTVQRQTIDACRDLNAFDCQWCKDDSRKFGLDTGATASADYGFGAEYFQRPRKPLQWINY